MKNRIKRGFTLLELIMVLSIISTLSAILIPPMLNIYHEEKNKIVEIYNGDNVKCYLNNECVYDSQKNGEADLSQEEILTKVQFFQDNYILVDIKYEIGLVSLYFKDKE